MTLTIKWNTLSIEEWENKFSRLPRSNILQSYVYARAMCPIARQRGRWGLILIDGNEAGLVQILEAGIFKNTFHAVILDRGPLWFDGYGTVLHMKLFFEEWNRIFPRRWGRKRRVLPETPDGPSAQKLLSQTGLKPEDRSGYQTFWLDLTKNTDDLRAALKSKWRGHLNKGERADLDISWDQSPAVIAWMLTVYAADKAERSYGGPSADFLKSYLPLAAQSGNLHVARALKDGIPLAFIVIITHGRSATYLIGWTSREGRGFSAHQRLLWEGLVMLQQVGIKDFDLGGVNDEDAADGLKTFKEGMGGNLVRYAGQYS